MLELDVYLKYKSYLERYLYDGAPETVLMEAYEELPRFLNQVEAHASDIIDIHMRALSEAMGVKRDNDSVQWIYLERATEFLTQILVVLDAAFLKLKERVEKDSLTGLANRLGYERYVKSVFEKAREQKLPLVLAMLDLDNFKEINDEYGHHTGDEVLRRAGRLLARLLRNDDFVARIGGDEFVLVLPHTDVGRAHIPLERIRGAFSSKEWLESLQEVTLHVSIGAAGYDGQEAVSPEDVLRRADIALYHAKKSGKDVLWFYEWLESEPEKGEYPENQEGGTGEEG